MSLGQNRPSRSRRCCRWSGALVIMLVPKEKDRLVAGLGIAGHRRGASSLRRRDRDRLRLRAQRRACSSS